MAEIRAYLAENNTRTILFINRKGFYSFVICLDCGNIIACASCRRPLTLHASTTRYYSCHGCQTQYPTTISCAQCNGWNLRGYGIGADQMARDIQKTYPGRPFWVYSDDAAKTKTEKHSIKKHFLESANGILIATELVLEDPELTAPDVIVVNIDNLFSIPDFRINERLLSLFMRLDEKATEHPLIIQTRFPSHPVFTHFARQDIKGLLAAELEERKAALSRLSWDGF